jgi:cytochrome c553
MKHRLDLLPVAGAVAALSCGLAPAAATEPSQERLEVCAGCHGEVGNSRMAGVPSLAGQPELFTTIQLILMREGIRQVEQMAPFVRDLTDDQIASLAAYYADQPAQASEEPVNPALAARGRELAQSLRCGTCHLPDYSGREQMPRLAKQRADYLIETMKAYRDNRRVGIDTSMNGIMYGISDADIAALAHFLASR